MGLRHWLRTRRENRQADYQRRLASLLKKFPHDSPIVVRALLADGPVAHCASQALAHAAEQREQDARLRMIIREELEQAVKGLRRPHL